VTPVNSERERGRHRLERTVVVSAAAVKAESKPHTEKEALVEDVNVEAAKWTLRGQPGLAGAASTPASAAQSPAAADSVALALISRPPTLRPRSWLSGSRTDWPGNADARCVDQPRLRRPPSSREGAKAWMRPTHADFDHRMAPALACAGSHLIQRRFVYQSSRAASACQRVLGGLSSKQGAGLLLAALAVAAAGATAGCRS
jgi:hypothetical protein